MSKCDICKKDIITYSSSRWAPTGLEFPLREDGSEKIRLCWDCYNAYKEVEKDEE